jgi:septation ring formation regulator EzrA
MVRCLLCDKKFKTKKGLSVHLARTHDVHGSHGRLSLKTIQKFFPLLKKKRWAKAEKFLKRTMENAEDDEWIKGYIHALSGMIVSLKASYSPPEPYIVSLKEFSNKKLQEIKDVFSDISSNLDSKNAFDAAYFQAWEDFTHYVLHTDD